jgi:hypothetical protein
VRQRAVDAERARAETERHRAARAEVQAFATKAKFARPRNLPPEDAKLGTVSMLPRVGADGFGDVPIRKAIVSTFDNDDLPVLRAAAAANVLSDVLGQKVTILEGGIRSTTDALSARGFEVILFVKW